MRGNSLQTCGEYNKCILCIVLVERIINFSEVPYEGIHKQILFRCRIRGRGKTCNVDNKEHKTIDLYAGGKPTSSTMAKYERKLQSSSTPSHW